MILASRAVTLSPANSRCFDTLGVAQYRNDNYPAAIKALQKSLDLGYKSREYSWFVLAMAHWKSGDQAQARNFYQQAVKRMRKIHPAGIPFPYSQFRDEAKALIQPDNQILNPKS